MPMIDEMRLKPLARSFREDCLPMISVIGADIEEPSSPKIDAIPDAMEKCARKNLQQSSMLCPQAVSYTHLLSASRWVAFLTYFVTLLCETQ